MHFSLNTVPQLLSPCCEQIPGQKQQSKEEKSLPLAYIFEGKFLGKVGMVAGAKIQLVTAAGREQRLDRKLGLSYKTLRPTPQGPISSSKAHNLCP